MFAQSLRAWLGLGLLLLSTWASASTLGIYSGTFDPIHLGHLSTATKAIEALHISRILIVPNVSPRHKRNASSFAIRWSLVKLAIGDDSRFLLPPAEVLRNLADRGDLVEGVVDWARQKFPETTTIYHIMGADSFDKLLSSRFKLEAVGKLGNDREVVVVSRPGTAKPAHPERYLRVHWIEAGGVRGMSSTKVRQDPLRWEPLLPEAVAKEIKRLGLYGRGSERGLWELPEAYVARWRWNHELIDFSKVKRTPLEWLSQRLVPANEVEIVGNRQKLPKGLLVTSAQGKSFRFFEPARGPGLENGPRYLSAPLRDQGFLVWSPDDREEPWLLTGKPGFPGRLSRESIQVLAELSRKADSVSRSERLHLRLNWLDQPLGLVWRGTGYGIAGGPKAGAPWVSAARLVALPTGEVPGLPAAVRASGLPPERFFRDAFVQPLTAQVVALALKHHLAWVPDLSDLAVEFSSERREDALPTGRFLFSGISGAVPSRAGEGPGSLSWISIRLRTELQILARALRNEFPELTSERIDRTYARAIRAAVSAETGTTVRGLQDLKTQWNTYLRRQENEPIPRLAR